MNNRVEQVPMGMPPRTALARVAFAAALGEPEQHRQHADEHRAGGPSVPGAVGFGPP